VKWPRHQQGRVNEVLKNMPRKMQEGIIKYCGICPVRLITPVPMSQPSLTADLTLVMGDNMVKVISL